MTRTSTTSTSNTISYDVVGAASSTTLAAPSAPPRLVRTSPSRPPNPRSRQHPDWYGNLQVRQYHRRFASHRRLRFRSIRDRCPGGARAEPDNATHSGDTDFGGSSSNTVSLTVNPADSTTAMHGAAQLLLKFGKASLSAPPSRHRLSGTATGTVTTFKSNGTAIGLPALPPALLKLGPCRSGSGRAESHRCLLRRRAKCYVYLEQCQRHGDSNAPRLTVRRFPAEPRSGGTRSNLETVDRDSHANGRVSRQRPTS